jgi:hypothetical protein
LAEISLCVIIGSFRLSRQLCRSGGKDDEEKDEKNRHNKYKKEEKIMMKYQETKMRKGGR